MPHLHQECQKYCLTSKRTAPHLPSALSPHAVVIALDAVAYRSHRASTPSPHQLVISSFLNVASTSRCRTLVAALRAPTERRPRSPAPSLYHLMVCVRRRRASRSRSPAAARQRHIQGIEDQARALFFGHLSPIPVENRSMSVAIWRSPSRRVFYRRCRRPHSCSSVVPRDRDPFGRPSRPFSARRAPFVRGCSLFLSLRARRCRSLSAFLFLLPFSSLFFFGSAARNACTSSTSFTHSRQHRYRTACANGTLFLNAHHPTRLTPGLRHLKSHETDGKPSFRLHVADVGTTSEILSL